MLYVKNNPDELWWCNSHQRRATYIDENGRHQCDPKLPGIMLPCMCVNLTGIAEISNMSEPEKISGAIEVLDEVLAHRNADKDGNHVMWIGEGTFLRCEQAKKDLAEFYENNFGP